MITSIDDKIRTVLADHAHTAVAVSELADDDDLYQAGLTSHASINVMLALEDEFAIEFNDELLRKSTFQSIASLRAAISQLRVAV